MLLKTRSRRLEPKAGRLVCVPHLGFVARHRCCICGAHPVHVHHPRVLGTDCAGARKASDCFALPVCARCHQGQGGIHHSGDENAWWPRQGIPFPLVLSWRIWAASYRAGVIDAEMMMRAEPLWKRAAERGTIFAENLISISDLASPNAIQLV